MSRYKYKYVLLFMHAVGSAFIGDAMSGTSSMGNVQVRGFMFGEHGRLCSSMGLCVSQGGCGLACARPSHGG